MSLTIKQFVLGPLQNNTFLVWDDDTQACAVVDPSYGSGEVLEFIRAQKLKLEKILITHAHFDHTGGVNELLTWPHESVRLYLHPDDQALWEAGGGSAELGFAFDQPQLRPTSIQHGEVISLGSGQIHVCHTPGHSPGHVIYYLPENQTALVGDLIFYHGVGRTDLPGGSAKVLIQSIHEQVLTLPGDTLLIPGHGSATSVGEEKTNNPFL
ncbi:MAG: hydrolase [Anaerolinea sp.]|nr:hydrolase [Anaerolinea sp.]